MKKPRHGRFPEIGIGQIGIIVKDIDQTMQVLTSLGIGPFHTMTGEPIIKREAFGQPVEQKFKAMFAQLGDLEIELVQPVAGKDFRKDFLDRTGGGLHHVGFFVDDIDKEVNKLVKKGFTVVLSGKRANGGGFAYIDPGKGALMIELIQR